VSFFEDFSLGIVHDVENKSMNLLFGERRVVKFLKITVDADHWRLTSAQVTVRCALFNPKCQ
jgi:hypothetical protein